MPGLPVSLYMMPVPYVVMALPVTSMCCSTFCVRADIQASRTMEETNKGKIGLQFVAMTVSQDIPPFSLCQNGTIPAQSADNPARCYKRRVGHEMLFFVVIISCLVNV